MVAEDEEATNQKSRNARPVLDEMSIEALTAYIVELETEIERVRAAIQEKQKARAGADAIFNFK